MSGPLDHYSLGIYCIVIMPGSVRTRHHYLTQDAESGGAAECHALIYKLGGARAQTLENNKQFPKMGAHAYSA